MTPARAFVATPARAFVTTPARAFVTTLAPAAALVLVTMLTLAPPAAANGRFDIDADGDGRYSLAELRTHYPALTLEAFDLIDGNDDCVVSPGEFRAGQDRGLLPEPTGG